MALRLLLRVLVCVQCQALHRLPGVGRLTRPVSITLGQACGPGKRTVAGRQRSGTPNTPLIHPPPPAFRRPQVAARYVEPIQQLLGALVKHRKWKKKAWDEAKVGGLQGVGVGGCRGWAGSRSNGRLQPRLAAFTHQCIRSTNSPPSAHRPP